MFLQNVGASALANMRAAVADSDEAHFLCDSCVQVLKHATCSALLAFFFFFILVRVEKEQSGELYGVELCMYYTAED